MEKKKKKSREKEKGGEGRRGEREIHTEEWRKAEVGQGGSVFRVFLRSKVNARARQIRRAVFARFIAI